MGWRNWTVRDDKGPSIGTKPTASCSPKKRFMSNAPQKAASVRQSEDERRSCYEFTSVARPLP